MRIWISLIFLLGIGFPAQSHANENPCETGKMPEIIETIVEPAEIRQITETRTRVIQQAHSYQHLNRPRHVWVKVEPPTDITEGFKPEPIPFYQNTFVPGEYEWQDQEKYILQEKSFDWIINPSGKKSKRTVTPIEVVDKKWVQTKPGYVEKQIVDYITPPPAKAGHKLVASNPAVYVERTVPAMTMKDTVVISQVRKPGTIQQSLGPCIASP